MTQPPAPPPLTPDQLAEIQRAHDRARKIRRAALVATSDAWIMAFFTACSALSILFDPLTNIPLTAALAFVTFNSFQGASALRRLNDKAPLRLALNQAFLATAIILYAAYSLYASLHPDPALAKQYAELASLDPDIGTMLKDWTRTLSLALYTTLIAGTLLAQGLTGLYYYTRKSLITRHLADTPPWVLDLQKRTATP